MTTRYAAPGAASSHAGRLAPATVLNSPASTACSRARTSWGRLALAGPLQCPSPAYPSTSAAAAGAYSRSSWRTAIQGEQGEQQQQQAGDSSTRPPTARGSTSHDHAPLSNSGSAGGGDCDGDGSGDGDGLSAAELRVKLGLAVGSGRLDLTDARLAELPAAVLELTELEELQLSGNCLTSLPDSISRLTALRRLGLAGNLLTELPAGVGSLTALEGLWLHGNLLEELPPQLGGMGALRALSLAGNCLTRVPHGSLSGLTSLTDLTLAGNRLTQLPPRELAPLVRLRKLALNGNRLGEGRVAAAAAELGLELGVGRHMTALQELMLQGNCLEAVDPAVFECPALTELSLADNRLISLPDRLAGASSLSRLHLFGNRLAAVSARQLAALPALSTCWLEGNPLGGRAVAELVAAAGSGGMPQLKVLGLDQSQLAAMRQLEEEGGGRASSSGKLPANVRVGCVLGSGPGYFKLQYGPQRRLPGAGDGGGAGGCGGSSNEVLVVAFGSAPGTPNWGGLLNKVYKAAQAEGESHFDVLYVADPSRDWYGGGDDASYAYYRSRLSSYTSAYRRVLLLGDSMGATAALLFADLATAALAFCPQVDLTAASIRPGRPAAWLDALRHRLMAAVAASPSSGSGPGPGAGGSLCVLVGTWQHDLAQANMLPQRGQQQAAAGGRGAATRRGSWRDGAEGSVPSAVPAGAAVHRSPWSWQQQQEEDEKQRRAGGSNPGEAAGTGVAVRVFGVDSHRLAAALDSQGQLVPLVREAVLAEMGLPNGIMRVSNLL